MSVFEGSTIGIDNPQSREEDEELEEQKRRQEELADLLAAGIDAFNYDDSTMNSSLTSADGADTNYEGGVKNKNKFMYDHTEKSSLDKSVSLESNYKDLNPQEHLKVLYEVRVREVNKLRDELNKFKEEKAKEMNILKNKVTLSEAELHHLQVTLSNSESLLVEKTEIIKNLKQTVNSKDAEIESLKKIVEQQNLEICTYKSTVNELHLKLADNNPFNNGTRKLNSEGLQKAHQDQIIKLETLLQEQYKKVQILEKEKLALEEDIKKLMQHKNEIEEDNNSAIVGLSKKLQSAQQQCKDLFLLGEAIKKESDHFKGRLHELGANKLDLSGEGNHLKDLDKDVMIHLEKLKRMLLDKDVELNTVRAKLKFYNNDLNELFEYREILNKMSSCEVKPCNDSEHEELIIFLQRQLQSYQQAIKDRNNQILSLNLVNKELQEKIEEMINQTRTDIQNLSQKYSLPQLETMSKELKHAEETINTLKQQLQGLQEKDENLIKELDKVFQEKQDAHNLAAQLKQALKEKDQDHSQLLKQIKEFKETELELTEENERVKTQLQKICLKLGLSEADIFESNGDVHELKSLQSKYGQIHDQLQHVLTHLENMNVKRSNIHIVHKLKKQIQGYLLNKQKLDEKQIPEKLEQWDNMLSDFIENLQHSENSTIRSVNDDLEELKNAKTIMEGEKLTLEDLLKKQSLELEEAKKEIVSLNESNNDLKHSLQEMNDQINKLKKCLKIVEDNKSELEKQMENTQKQLNEAKQEAIDLHKEVNKAAENTVRRTLFKELKDVESILEQTSDDVSNSDVFQKCLQAELLKAEIALRDQLQEENVRKMQKIENQYKNVISEKTELFNKEKEKWKRQEANYSKQFASVLEECGKKMQELEDENLLLRKRINILHQEYKAFKNTAMASIEKYNKMIADSKKALEDSKKCVTLLEYYMMNAAKIEKQRQKSVKSVFKKMNLNQAEVRLIENVYNEKINKIKAEKMNMLK